MEGSNTQGRGHFDVKGVTLGCFLREDWGGGVCEPLLLPKCLSWEILGSPNNLKTPLQPACLGSGREGCILIQKVWVLQKLWGACLTDPSLCAQA